MTLDRRAVRDARTPASARLERLRARRTWNDRATPIGVSLEAIRRELAQHEKASGPALEAWTSVIPHELAARSTIVSLKRGTLTVRIPDSASRYATDRLLRAGAEIKVLKQCPRHIKRIRLVP
ncbi:MAG: DciA family protein [Planctomycetota bacterium]